MNSVTHPEHLQAFVEQSPMAIAMVDREMNYLLASHRWLTDLGIEDVTGRSYYEDFPSEDNRAIHQRCLAGLDWQQEGDIQPWITEKGEIGGLFLWRGLKVPKPQEDLQTLLEAVTDYEICRLDPTGRFCYWNKGAERIFGYKKEEIIGQHFSQFYEPEDIQKGLPQEHLAIATRQGRFDLEGWRRRTDGTRFWATVVITALRDKKNGELLGFAKVSRDITERKQAREYLCLLERAIAASGNGIVISSATQADRPLMYVNPSFEQITGYTKEEVIGQNCRFLQGKDTDPRAIAQLRDAIETGKECNVVLQNYRKDGTAFWNELHVAPVRDETGKLTHYVGIQNNITERLEAERDLHKTLQREWLTNAIALRIRQSLNLEYVLNTAVKEIRSVLKTDRVIIYRFAPDWSGEAVVESVGEGWMPILGLPIHDPCFQESKARLYQEGHIRAIKNIYTEERLAPCHVELLARFQVQANLVVPIFIGSQYLSIDCQKDSCPIDGENTLWGLLVAHHCQSPRQWESGEIELLKQLSLQISVAIQQANLFKQLEIELQRSTLAKNALQRSNSVLQAQQEAAIDAILVIDEIRQVASYNRRFQEMWQIPEDVMASGDDRLLLNCVLSHLKDPQEFLTKVEYLYAHPDECSRDEIYLQDGRVFDRYSGAVFSPNGKDYGRIWYFRDISDRVAAQREQKALLQSLQDSETRFRTLVDNIPGAIYRAKCSSHWYLEFISEAIADISGYPAYDLIHNASLPFSQIVHPDDRDSVERQWQLAIQEKRSFQIEYRIIAKDGETRTLYDRGQTVLDGETVLWVDGAMFDITEQKKAEVALRQSEILRASEAKNRALLNAIPDLFIRIHQDGTYLDVKADKTKKLLATPKAQIGQNIYDILPSDVAHQRMYYVNQALQTGTIQVFEYQLRMDSELHDYEARLVANGDDEVLAIIRDITERKKVERLKNEFVSIVSHELRTPLTSVRGSLSLIAGGVVGEIPPEAKVLLDIAYKNSERLILLINDILDIEKIESGKMDFDMTPMELNPIIEQAIEVNRAYAEPFGVQLVLSAALPEVKVSVDRDRLLQVLTNLLSNAAKFSPPNDIVTIELSRQERQILPYVTQTFIRVSISDRGSGISNEFRNQIFQKFAQADASDTRRQAGTGLGLNICKAIVEKLGGEIGFQSVPHVQTTFYFDLPEWQDSAPIISMNPVENSDRDNRHLLICEDDPDIAKLLSLMLQQDGFTTDIAYDAAQAKQLMTQNLYAALTVDLSLPGQSGISLIRELRSSESTQSLPIIVVSAKAKQGREELQGGGFAVVDWLDKPIDQSRLRSIVRQATCQQLDSKPEILHIEDDPDLTQVIHAILHHIVKIDTAANLSQAKQKLSTKSFDLVILDLSLPDGSGLELLSYLNAQTRNPTPVLVFSAKEVTVDATNQVAAALVKSRTSNQQLLDTINSLIDKRD